MKIMTSVSSYQGNLFSKKTIILCALMWACLAMASTSWAATYYVDENNANASDSNPGTQSSPWKTIQKGASVAKAGDTVYVKNGVYYEWVNIANSGTAGHPITLMAYPGDHPIIDGSKTTIQTSYDGLLNSRNKSYITFDGFEVRNSNAFLIQMGNGDHLIVRNCIAHDNTTGGTNNNQSGIYMHDCNAGIIEHNEVYHTGHNAISSDSTNNVIVQYNYVHDNPAHNGINMFPKTNQPQNTLSGNIVRYNILTGATHGIYMRYQTNNEISNNLIYGNLKGGIIFTNYPGDSINFVANTAIYNNTITGNNGHGIQDDNASHITIENNILYNNSSSAIYIASGASSGNTENHNLTSNPSFTDASNNDYTLKSTSSAIDAGIDLSSVGITDDIVGTPRPQGNGFDIGAYEYTNGTISVNNPPIAQDDTATTPENTPVSVAVLSNDSDPDGDTLSLTGTTSPSNGTAKISGSDVQYTPNAGFYGTDTFTYTIQDSKGATASATVTVTVTKLVLTPPSNLHAQ